MNLTPNARLPTRFSFAGPASRGCHLHGLGPLKLREVFEIALTEAQQYVRECQGRVRKQAALVDRLEKYDHRGAAKDARETLVAFERDLELALAHFRLERAVYEAPLV
jgi:hypothetical protein